MAVRFAEFAGRAVVQRRLERRWEVRIGGRAVALSHVRLEQAWAEGGSLPVVAHGAAPRRHPFRAALATVVGLFAGLMVIVLAAQSYRASARSDYSLSLAVPPAQTGWTPPSARPARPIRRGRVTVHPSVSSYVAAPPAAGTKDMADGDGADDPVVPLQTMQHALDAALTTGAMQQWAEAGGRHGYVIAGPQEAGSGQQCRQLSVLTREAGEADQVDMRRSCAPVPH